MGVEEAAETVKARSRSARRGYVSASQTVQAKSVGLMVAPVVVATANRMRGAMVRASASNPVT